MIIKFQDYSDTKSFNIKYLQYQIDENGNPVDIIIISNKETLENIGAMFSLYDYNIQHASEGTIVKCCDSYTDIYEGLFARLHPFTIEKATKCYFFD